jgi:hypothetical protein
MCDLTTLHPSEVLPADLGLRFDRYLAQTHNLDLIYKSL